MILKKQLFMRQKETLPISLKSTVPHLRWKFILVERTLDENGLDLEQDINTAIGCFTKKLNY